MNGHLIERLRADLTEALPPPVLRNLTLYIAASELAVEDLQPADRGALRIAAAHLALQTLGVDDARIERAKTQLATGRNPVTLNRRQ